MNKEEILNILKEKNIWFELEDHEAVFNMEDLNNLKLKYKDRDAKNIFLRDDKKQNYYLITVKEDKRVDLKQFRKDFNTRNLSFASSEDLMRILNLVPGSVSPLGILNDNELKVTLYLDEFFLSDNGIIGVHPNENTATIWLKVTDLVNLIEQHGNQLFLVSL